MTSVEEKEEKIHIEFGYFLPDWRDEANKEKERKNEGDDISETPKAVRAT